MKTLYSIAVAGLAGLAGCHGNSVSKEELAAGNRPVQTPTSVGEVVGIGRIEPEGKLVKLAVNAGGVVRAIHQREGQIVRAGDLILSLDNAVEQSRRAELNGRMLTQIEQIGLTHATHRQATVQRDLARRNWERTQKLHENKAETGQNAEKAEADYRAQEAAVEAATRQIALAQTRLTELKQAERTAQAELQTKVVRAPADGVLLDLSIDEGEAVLPLSPFADFAPAGRTMAVAEIDELFANQVRVGQTVQVRLVGQRTNLTNGRVIYAAPYLRRKSLFSEKVGDQEDRRVREIRVALDKPDGLLFNTRVECIIKTN